MVASVISTLLIAVYLGSSRGGLVSDGYVLSAMEVT